MPLPAAISLLKKILMGVTPSLCPTKILLKLNRAHELACQRWEVMFSQEFIDDSVCSVGSGESSYVLHKDYLECYERQLPGTSYTFNALFHPPYATDTGCSRYLSDFEKQFELCFLEIEERKVTMGQWGHIMIWLLLNTWEPVELCSEGTN